MDIQNNFKQSSCALLAPQKKRSPARPVNTKEKGKRLLAKQAVEKGRRIRRTIALAVGILAGLCALIPQFE